MDKKELTVFMMLAGMTMKNAELMKHQVRGANMALLVFGAVREDDGGNT